MATPSELTLRIQQQTRDSTHHLITLELSRSGHARQTASADIDFALTPQEHADLRWYLEDYLQRADSVTADHVLEIERWMQTRGEDLYRKVLRANDGTVDLWASVRNELADLRIEITTGVADAAAIPWELMFEPTSGSAIALRVRSFVRVQSAANIRFVQPPSTDELGRVRLLYVVCRPDGTNDVGLRAIVNQLRHELGDDLHRFDITALRPPTYEQLQQVLADAKAAGRAFHIVHFDGHGMYADLQQTTLAAWAKTLSPFLLGADSKGRHGYLLFEHPDAAEKMRPVPGSQLGKLLHDHGVPMLVLNACQSAMHAATERPAAASDVHDEVRAIGSLAQEVVDQGIPAVLGMRYSVFVVTAAQYIGRLYAALAKGRSFGQAASEGRRHLFENPERWVGLEPRPLRDWCVPVVFEAAPWPLFPEAAATPSDEQQQQIEQRREQSRAALTARDPVLNGSLPLKYVPDTGFIGRDETLLLLDRAFDAQRIVLLHAYAGQGKTSTAVEFARWYASTGGLGARPNVLLTSFETTTTLQDVLDQIGQVAVNDWAAINQHEERQRAVLAVLRSVPLLWIWDNVEPVAGFPAGTESAWTAAEQRELADFLKLIKLDPQCRAKVLLTSRRDESSWLGGIPFRVEMPRMRRSDAARLAQQLGAERQLTRLEINGWQPLLSYCAGNPLTLRVLVSQAVRMGLRGEAQIAAFVQAVRDGEQQIQDTDAAQGRDVSLGASLDYGFQNAFSADELPIVALLHLFQGAVDGNVLAWMGQAGEYALPELAGRSAESLTKLLDRCRETGLLTHLGETWYTIHPALPWFLRQLFARHYPSALVEQAARLLECSEENAGEPPTPRATAALRAWVEAVGELGSHYHNQFGAGDRDVIQPLVLEESNLLHARRVSRRQGWWSRVISAMQGLRVLYEYQGRTAEWSRLVSEILPDYCTATDAPRPGREDAYGFVMSYRVRMAQQHDRDLPQAATLQEKRVAWDRQQAASVLALPPDAPLDANQRNRLRTLGVSVFTLGQILSEQGSGDCVPAYEETVRLDQRIGDTAAEAITHYNLGHAYMDLPDLRDLDAAEAAYKLSLGLFDADDAVGRCGCLQQIGTVHFERYKETRASSEPADTQLRHAQAAESYCHQALALCPATAITALGPIHNQLGILYKNVGQTEPAREHFEKDVQICEQTGDRYGAGQTRFNLAQMYASSASDESTPSGREKLLRRAQTYAAAAQRDYQHYEGRAAAEEAQCQQLIDAIQQQLSQ